jgi:methionyl-tRNA formyltransferase
MRILLLVNNWVGWQIAEWLYQQHADIVGVVVHPPEKSAYRDEIVQIANAHQTPVWNAPQLRASDTLAAMQALNPDIAISGLFGYILKSSFLQLLPGGCINVHPAFLPYNRGAYTNVWSIVEQTPAGVTIHYIDEGIDTGDIIAQVEVPVEPIDTGESLYRKLEHSSIHLFQQTWPQIEAGQVQHQTQPTYGGTHHYTRDTDALDQINLEKLYTARDLLNILRARTFPPHQGAYFWHNGRRVFIRVQLWYE